MAKRAVCVGSNDYPGTYNDLNGCVNDANDWADLLISEFEFGENVTRILDAEATVDRICTELEGLVTGAEADDIVVFTFSGHGTWVYDQGERDESDNRDEALCGYDGNILDDQIRAILRQLDPGANLTIISDSCHSGTVTRSQLRSAGQAEPEEMKQSPKPRYMPPADDVDAIVTDMYPIRNRAMYPESGMPSLLLTGCNAMEYSYDAFLNDRYNGAMTAMAQRIIRSNTQQTYRELHKTLRQILPSTRFPQSPQLEGTDARKDRKLFS